MGTSSRMTPSIKGQPNWGDLSGTVTKACNGEETPKPTVRNILKKFINAAGGSNKVSRGKSNSVGKAGISTGKRIAGFFGNVSTQGFQKAIKETGLDDLRGKTTQEVVNHLIDYCAENAGTIDEVAARAAAANLFDEIFNEIEDMDNIEKIFSKKMNNDWLHNTLISFFAHYIHVHLSTRFVEKLEQAKSSKHCNKLFKEIKDIIFEDVKLLSKQTNLTKINWSGRQGNQIIKNIFEDILTIYN